MKNNTKLQYVAPVAQPVETKIENLICGSGNTTPSATRTGYGEADEI